MVKNFFYLTLLTSSIFISGCGSSDTASSSQIQGWHFQGRDCLSCHNIDLATERNLLIGATLYKNEAIKNQDDLSEMCGGNLKVNFYDSQSPNNLVYSSSNYFDSNSNGYKGKGNIFILKRKLSIISSGSYNMEIRDEDDSILAKSLSPHNFSSQEYDVNNAIDYSNRLSCNVCHSPDLNSPQVQLYINEPNALTLCK